MSEALLAPWPLALLALAIGYLLGSIPFGLLLTRMAGAGDIRAIGSGNIGATNVLRTGRRSLAAATLLGDTFKGTAAVLIGAWLGGRNAALAAGLGAVMGHVSPVWLGFKGGKGIATYLGVLIAVAWPIAAAFGLVWITVAAVTRYSSLSGLAASVATPLLLWLFVDAPAALLFVVLTVLVLTKHRANIARLLAGTEPKIGASKQAAP